MVKTQWQLVQHEKDAHGIFKDETPIDEKEILVSIEERQKEIENNKEKLNEYNDEAHVTEIALNLFKLMEILLKIKLGTKKNGTWGGKKILGKYLEISFFFYFKYLICI